MELARTVGRTVCAIGGQASLFDCLTQSSVEAAGITAMTLLACALAFVAASASGHINRLP